MQAGVVEPGDPLDDRELELGSVAPDQLGLEGVDKRLGEGVVIGVSDRAHRSQHAVVGELLGVVEGRLLRAAIGVAHETDVGAGPALVKRHPQRVEDEIGAHVGRELPADDAARVGVDHERE